MSLSLADKICPNCNSNIPADSEFCQFCGSRIETEMNFGDEVVYNETIEIPSNSSLNNNQKKVKGYKIKRIFEKKNLPFIIFAIVILISVIVNVVLVYNVVSYKKLYEKYQDKYEELKNENIYADYGYWADNHEKVDFIDENVVFVENDGSNRYHKFECNKFVGNNYWVFNLEYAIYIGYIACPLCH